MSLSSFSAVLAQGNWLRSWNWQIPFVGSVDPHLISSCAFERLSELAPGWDKHAPECLHIAGAVDKDAAREEDTRLIGHIGADDCDELPGGTVFATLLNVSRKLIAILTYA